MSSEVIQPKFDAKEARFLSNNQNLVKALVKQIDDAIRFREESLEYALRHNLNFSDTGVVIVTDGIHEQHATILITRALGHLYAKNGYSIDDVANSSITLSWRDGEDRSQAAASKLRTMAWEELYSQLDDIKNNVLNVALLNVVNDEVTVGIPYQRALGQSKQASYISSMLFGYKQKGFHVFETAKNDHHEITISW